VGAKALGKKMEDLDRDTSEEYKQKKTKSS
jgi:hypothetical protein